MVEVNEWLATQVKIQYAFSTSKSLTQPMDPEKKFELYFPTKYVHNPKEFKV